MTGSEKKLRWEHYAAALLLGAMSLIAFLNILGRYLFHYSLAFTEEITINLILSLIPALSLYLPRLLGLLHQ